MLVSMNLLKIDLVISCCVFEVLIHWAVNEDVV